MDGLDQSPLWGIIGVIIGLVVYIIRRDKRNKNIIFYLLFCCYLGIVFSYTLLPLPLSQMSREAYKNHAVDMINIIPLINGMIHFNYYVLREWILNIIMLMPFGFLVSLAFKGQYDIKKIILYSFVFSMIIELLQLSISYCWIGVGYRTCDVNDLLFNTIGCVVGYMVLKIIRVLKEKFIIKLNS
ncbi:MAG: VanZ family protein [Erysipelotrichaceae bacterium]|nr:VanZ family protein [Erysipelotrichaceae bacterium]